MDVKRLLQRVAVGVCIAVVMMFVHKAARADTIPYIGTYYTQNGGDTTHYSTAMLACSANPLVPSWHVFAIDGGSPYICHWTANDGSGGDAAFSSYAPHAGSGCISGYHDNGAGACDQDVAPTCPAAGTLATTGNYDWGTSPSPAGKTYTCDGSCGQTFSGSITSTRIVAGVVHYYATGNYSSDGQTCTTSTSIAPAAIPTSTCGSGQSQGTVNGVTVCVNTSTGVPVVTTAPSVTSTTNSTVTNPDSSTTETTVRNNSDGSVSTTVKECASGACNSTTTRTGVGGVAGGIPVPPLDISSLNKEGTQLAIKAGQCGGVGQQKCSIDEGDTATSSGTTATARAAADTAMNGAHDSIVDRVTAATGSPTESNAITGIPSGDLVGAGSCVPYVIAFVGAPVTIDPCPYKDNVQRWLGYAFYITTFLTIMALFFGAKAAEA